MSKLWSNLTKQEWAEYMRLQMSPSGTGRRGYLPEDCSECSACGQPMLGSGFCPECYARWDQLSRKLEGADVQ